MDDGKTPSIKVHSLILFLLTILLICTSCSHSGQDFDSPEEALQTYQSYLSSLKQKRNSNTDDFCKEIRNWKETSDTVFHFLMKDSVIYKSPAFYTQFIGLHDSIRIEMLRLTETWQYSYADVLKIKEKASPFFDDEELHDAVNEAKPFFNSLDSLVISKNELKPMLTGYRQFLTRTEEHGIHNKQEMLDFIRQEDVFFRSFLSHLYKMENEPLSDITKKTENICNNIFLSARKREIPARDAVVYMSMRTVRRLLQNSSVCLSDMGKRPLKSKAQSNAYVWMILQPFISIDQFSIATLTPQGRDDFERIARHLPSSSKIAETLDIDKRQLNYLLPQQLLKMYILTL